MSRPVHVLLVEDNAADADLAVESLNASKLHIDLDVASDGAQALAYLRREGEHGEARRPDVILLDLNMPGIDGRQVLRACKEDPELRRIPVVVLTSSEAERDIVESYDLGANCYVIKPVGLEAFTTIVASIEDFWFTVVQLPAA